MDLTYFSKYRQEEVVLLFIYSRQLLKAWTLLETLLFLLHCLKPFVLDLFPICLVFAYIK